MKLPCQMIVWDVLPAIRAAIAEELVNCGLSQQEIARELDMAPSAVSQYLSKKRGYRIVFDEDVKQSIRALAEDMKAGNVDDLAGRICRICKQLRSDEQQCIDN
ncbi:transcriptional regulator [Methanolobus sp. WCC5]|uniref:transcriptional regulator n=1 Tax=Methanolobus sp. WCC5 TaxID=3125785 RepID=UPI0032519279